MLKFQRRKNKSDINWHVLSIILESSRTSWNVACYLKDCPCLFPLLPYGKPYAHNSLQFFKYQCIWEFFPYSLKPHHNPLPFISFQFYLQGTTIARFAFPVFVHCKCRDKRIMTLLSLMKRRGQWVWTSSVNILNECEPCI